MTDGAGAGSADLDQPLAGDPGAALGRAEAVAAGPSHGARTALVVAAALVLFVLVPLGLAVRAGWQPLLELDRTVSDALVVPGRGTDHDLLRLLTAAGLVQARFVVLMPLAVWFSILRRWQLAIFVVVAGLGVSPLNGLLKMIFDRSRPSYEDTIDIGGLSFPSGHSSGAAALASILIVVAWPVLTIAWRWVWVTVAALFVMVVGFTRIALGAHYLTDVIAGWSFGVAWVLMLAVLLQVWPGLPGALPSRGARVSA